MKQIILTLLVLCIVCSATLTSAGGIEPVQQPLEFSPESPQPIKPWDFAVTDDGILIIPDFEAGDIKLYQNNGSSLTWLTTIGEKGYGPDQFARPAHMVYNNKTRTLAVMDLGLRKIFIYNRTDLLDFERVQTIPCRRGGYEIKLTDDGKLFISGGVTSPNNERYAFYSINLSGGGQINYLMPYHLKFGVESSAALTVQFKEKGFGAIGALGTFDIHGDTAYYAWEGNLNVRKINVKSGLVHPKTFVTQTRNYSKPYLSSDLDGGYQKRDLLRMRQAKKKMSLVRKVFVTKERVLVVFEGPLKEKSRFWIQSYSLDGTFLREDSLKGQPSRMMFLDKAQSMLYSLSNEEGGKRYYILKYKIN